VTQASAPVDDRGEQRRELVDIDRLDEVGAWGRLARAQFAQDFFRGVKKRFS
jgi:hypothetical protein